MTADPAQRLRELGITLPPAPPIAGAFVQTVTTGDLVFTSGQIAVDGDNGLLATGKVGTEDVDTETATACARQCALNSGIGVAALPFDSPVEVEATVELR